MWVLFLQWKATSSPQIRTRAWLSEALIFCNPIALFIPWETHVDTTYSGHSHPYFLPLTLLGSMLCPLQPLSTSWPLLTLAYNPLVWLCCPFVNVNGAIMEHSQSTRVHTHKTTDSPRSYQLLVAFQFSHEWGLVLLSHSTLGWWLESYCAGNHVCCELVSVAVLSPSSQRRHYFSLAIRDLWLL